MEEDFVCSVCGFWFCQCPGAEVAAAESIKEIFQALFGPRLVTRKEESE